MPKFSSATENASSLFSIGFLGDSFLKLGLQKNKNQYKLLLPSVLLL